MNRLRRLRQEKNISQSALASYLGVTQQTVSAYESGDREPDLETLNKMADFFDVSVDYLLGRTDIRNSADKIAQALKDDPELLEFWEDLSSRENLKIMFKQAKDLPDSDIRTLIMLIRRFKQQISTLF